MKKIFTELDLCQNYNNIWIKKKNEQKVVFTTLEGLFKLIVMFFRLMNILAIFQIIINEILLSLINTGELANFINNIIVGIEKEEVYDEIVKKVVKRLAENDLYVKLEKYKQKVREVEFLGVVIGLEGIKRELKWKK